VWRRTKKMKGCDEDCEYTDERKKKMKGCEGTMKKRRRR